MRLSLILAALLSSSFMLFGQSTPFFITEHGGGVPNLNLQFQNSDTLDNGNFVLLVNQTSVAGFDEDVSLLEIDPTSGEVLNSSVISLPGDQFGVAMVKVPGGNIWVATSTVNLAADNFSDVALLEIGADLNLITEYTYDLARYEDIESIGLGGEGLVSVITQASNENFGNDDFHLLTVNTNDGTEVSNVLLVEDDRVTDLSYIQPGVDGQVLIQRASGATANFWGVDVINGEIDFTFDEVPEGACAPNEAGLPLNQNALYSEAKNAYIVPTTCLSVLEISAAGDIAVKSNAAGIIIQSEFPFARVVASPNGFVAYSGENSYVVTDNGDTYFTESENNYGFASPVALGPLLGETYLTANYQNDSLNIIIADLENLTLTNNSVEGLMRSSIFTSNEHVIVDGDEVVTLEKMEDNYQALFYTLEGELFDSISFPQELGTPVGIGIGADGNLVTGMLGGDDDGLISIVRFSRSAGVIETVVQFPIERPLGPLSINFQVGGPDKDFYFLLNGYDFAVFEFAQTVLRIDNTGEVVYGYQLPLEYEDFTFEPIAVDEAGNVYIVRVNENDDVVFLSLDPSGNLRFLNEVSNSGNLRPLIHSMEVNDAGDRVAVFVEQNSSEVSNRIGNFIELSAVTGDLLREVAYSPDHTYTFSNEGIYQSGTNNVLVFNTYFRGDDVPVDESIALQFTVIGEGEDILFQRDVVTSYYGLPNTRDIAVGPGFMVYGVGRRFPVELNTSVSTLIGINYDEVVSVEDAPNLDETASLKVFPNPTSDLAQITWDNLQNTTYELTLTTLDGRLVSRWAGQVASGRATLDVDMSRLPLGTYVARLVTPNGNSTQRIMKQ